MIKVILQHRGILKADVTIFGALDSIQRPLMLLNAEMLTLSYGADAQGKLRNQ